MDENEWFANIYSSYDHFIVMRSAFAFSFSVFFKLWAGILNETDAIQNCRISAKLLHEEAKAKAKNEE